jgi:hypothetical protein
MTHPAGRRHPPGAGDLDPVIEAYKKDVDRTLLRENLRLSVEERLRNLMRLQAAAEEWRLAGARLARGPVRDDPPGP